jgi:hypothetical protein
MYCNRCGKYLEGDSTLCTECEKAERKEKKRAEYYIDTSAEPYYEPEIEVPEKDNRMYGFGKSLASTIIGFVAFMWSYIMVISIISENAGMVASFILVLIGLIITSLVLGLKSIFLFNKRRRLGAAKPIATLILGINGVSLAGLAALIGFLMTFVAMLALSAY